MREYGNIENFALVSVKHFPELQVDVTYYVIFEMNDFSDTR